MPGRLFVGAKETGAISSTATVGGLCRCHVKPLDPTPLHREPRLLRFHPHLRPLVRQGDLVQDCGQPRGQPVLVNPSPDRLASQAAQGGPLLEVRAEAAGRLVARLVSSRRTSSVNVRVRPPPPFAPRLNGFTISRT